MAAEKLHAIGVDKSPGQEQLALYVYGLTGQFQFVKNEVGDLLPHLQAELTYRQAQGVGFLPANANWWNQQLASALRLQSDLVIDPALRATINKAILAATVDAKHMKVCFQSR